MERHYDLAVFDCQEISDVRAQRKIKASITNERNVSKDYWKPTSARRDATSPNGQEQDGGLELTGSRGP
jgi:hypothetical protein